MIVFCIKFVLLSNPVFLFGKSGRLSAVTKHRNGLRRERFSVDTTSLQLVYIISGKTFTGMQGNDRCNLRPVSTI